jgi:hypothetical protein
MAIINPGASVRVMPQAPQINARDFAPDAEGLQRAQLAGITLGKEIADLSLAGDRLKVEKAKLKAAEAAVKFGLKEAEANARRAMADAQNAETRNDPKELVRQEAVALGLNPEDYGDDFDRLQADRRLLQQRNLAFQRDPSLTQEQLRERLGRTLAESMSGTAVDEAAVPNEGAMGTELGNSQVGGSANSVPFFLQKPQREKTAQEVYDETRPEGAFKVPEVGTELSAVTVPGAPAADQELAAADDALAQFDELKGFRDRLAPPGTSPRSAALFLFQRDNPGRSIQSMSPNEQAEALKPYLDAAKPEVISRTFLSDGNSYKVDIRQSKDGEIVYGIDEPLLQRSAPETTATATVKNKLAFINETDQRIDMLLKNLDNYEKAGAFGVFDTWMATTAANPERGIPIRAAASRLSNLQTNKLVADLAAIGAKTMTELAGAAQTAGEAQRLGPYVPASGDVVLGPQQLRDKIESFRTQLQISREAIQTQFGITPTRPLGEVEPRDPAGQDAGRAKINSWLREISKAVDDYKRDVVPTAR